MSGLMAYISPVALPIIIFNGTFVVALLWHVKKARFPESRADALFLTCAYAISAVVTPFLLIETGCTNPGQDGDVGTLFTYYSISDLYNGQYMIGDPQIQGEEKVYVSQWQNHTVGVVQEANIADVPVNMELLNLPSSQVLILTSVNGYNVPLPSVPSSISNLHDNLRFNNQTFIEPRESLDEQVPTVNFTTYRDLLKEFDDNRQREVNLNDILEQYSRIILEFCS